MKKTLPQQIAEDESSFSTLIGYTFKFREPRYPSEEQITEMADYMQNIENMMETENMEYMKYMDVDSLAKQFLIDKIVLEKDAMQMSTYFYREKSSDILYAGPMWDYDRAMGEILWDYELPLEDEPNGMYRWYISLYNREEFYQVMLASYQKLMPYFHKLLNEDIDAYVKKISASMAMDRVLMACYARPNETTSYTAYESYVKYLKYFLANRLNYLSGLWGGDSFKIPESSGEYHKLVLAEESGNILETRTILDGDCVVDLPKLDESVYWGWSFSNRSGTSDKLYQDKIPIYEDIVLYAKYK